MRRQFIDRDGEDENHQRREHRRLDALVAYCEATRCRRVALLGYFGDASEPCGNCDVCLDPPTMIDGTTEARLLFATVARTGESFGAAHIVDVLRGVASEKIRARGHDALPTWGAGQARAKAFWQGFIRQAVAGGFLAIDIERFGGLRLTAAAREVLRGAAEFRFRDIPATAKDRAARRRRGVDLPHDDIDAALLSRLKALRRDLAAARGVPAYVVFADATLHDMCRLRPETPEQMALVNGVGPKKLEDFGPRFLDAIRGHDGPA
jgi:ATP-dependent DNA helicase RecQ